MFTIFGINPSSQNNPVRCPKAKASGWLGEAKPSATPSFTSYLSCGTEYVTWLGGNTSLRERHRLSNGSKSRKPKLLYRIQLSIWDWNQSRKGPHSWRCRSASKSWSHWKQTLLPQVHVCVNPNICWCLFSFHCILVFWFVCWSGALLCVC